MAYQNSVLKALRDRWENPERHDESLLDFAQRRWDFTSRQVYNRLRRLAPDRNETSIPSITGKGHSLVDAVDKHTFPDDEDKALAQTLQSINIEPKQALLLTIDGLGTHSEHYTTINNIVNEANLRDRASFDTYTDILHRTGMLNAIHAGNALNHTRTEYDRSTAGRRVGSPAATGALDYAVQHGKSLYDVIGQVDEASKTNSVYTRATILETIQDTTGQPSINDLDNALNDDRDTIEGHVRFLTKHNMIKRGNPRSRSKRYRVQPHQLDNVDEPIRQELKANAFVTANGIAENTRLSRSTAQRRLKQLHDDNYVQSPTGATRTQLSLSGEATAFVRYLDEVRGLINNDRRGQPLRDMHRKYQEKPSTFKNNVRRGFELHADASPHVTAGSKSSRLAHIVSIVEQHDNPCTQEIAEKAQLSDYTTKQYLNELKPWVTPVEERRGTRNHYRRTQKAFDKEQYDENTI